MPGWLEAVLGVAAAAVVGVGTGVAAEVGCGSAWGTALGFLEASSDLGSAADTRVADSSA